LYKIYEVIRDDIGREEELLQRNYVASDLIKRFTGTVQSRKMIGDEARHAAKKYKGHSNPMTIDDAKKMIKEIFEKWIEEKMK